MQTGIYKISEEKDTPLPAMKALRIIWFTGIICVATGIFYFLNPFGTENDVGYQSLVTTYENKEVKSIDQLLLSSEEALLADKKSFVNGALRFQWRNQEPDLNQGNNRIILYNNILKKKLSRIPRSQVADFSIKPVPK